MKNNIKIFSALLLGTTLLMTACKKDDNPAPATVYYQQVDQFGRPAINTVFNDGADKDAFNVTAPTAQNAAFQAKFQAKLQALNGGLYTTNALGLDAATFTGLLATDVLDVSLSNTTPTTFFDGINVLTGRNLSDDVISTELLLIFGGPTGADNPTLTDDHVSTNDKAFLSTFPYEAAPF